MPFCSQAVHCRLQSHAVGRFLDRALTAPLSRCKRASRDARTMEHLLGPTSQNELRPGMGQSSPRPYKSCVRTGRSSPASMTSINSLDSDPDLSGRSPQQLRQEILRWRDKYRVMLLGGSVLLAAIAYVATLMMADRQGAAPRAAIDSGSKIRTRRLA